MSYPLIMAGHNGPDAPGEQPKWQDERPGQISLHGLGFLQVVLPANRRLHVWHPALPRRKCFQHSQVHDHRFSFESQVLVGVQRNVDWVLHGPGEVKGLPTHIAYKHEGPRTKYGNRPWIEDYQGVLVKDSQLDVHAGEKYSMKFHCYHSTEPMGDGRVATLMTKTHEVEAGAHSLCRIGVQPDVNFDRHQMIEADMWSIVLNVLAQTPLDASTWLQVTKQDF